MNGYVVQHARVGRLAAAVSAALLPGCLPGNLPCPGSGSADAGTPSPGSELYTGTGDPYLPGRLPVRTISLARCEQATPLPVQIHAPEQGAGYPVVVLQHAFMTRNAWYADLARHVASHGFVLVVPQMYEPGLGPLLGNPTADDEAAKLMELLDWLPDHLGNVTGIAVRWDRLGLAGHSRGGKVVWLVLNTDPARAMAVAGIDPVDGTGGPFGNQARVVQGPFAYSLPTLILGTELGGACAPAGDNHEQFYAAARSPAWHLFVPEQGHLDMLDDNPETEFVRSFCQAGRTLDGMRRLVAGVLVAFFRGTLQGDASALDLRAEPSAAPIPFRAEAK